MLNTSTAHAQRSYPADTLPHKLPNINQTGYSSPKPQWNQDKSHTRFNTPKRPQFINNTKPHRNFKQFSKRRNYQHSNRNQSNQHNTCCRDPQNKLKQNCSNALSKAPKPGAHEVQHIAEHEQTHFRSLSDSFTF
ncbi:uncharacterized protein NDAI_0F02690 [Naumovozyma dairenensis CBS 421]|uniref:Uncharacterized protein n=1 Tax=Naumovozyma dairenensis (strain ATCC 10597 / BCRC 20456 / CBS 421 / NBRC 0211 / NRRL Y-12639) TaxID=1071378 RepID=G0WCS6_NAUDC|nr:hypothetical protein NDAI_0F02690 [Naumovozyma dairenensis CBS 421]CCD25587.1 hypothetical protein NDAI_0F02690 [Naumovozyma dairenensis CBS 421]